MAVAHWVDSMARDENLAKDDWKARALDAELREFEDHVWGERQHGRGGREAGKNSWMKGMGSVAEVRSWEGNR